MEVKYKIVSQTRFLIEKLLKVSQYVELLATITLTSEIQLILIKFN